jgi:hypothetical protein
MDVLQKILVSQEQNNGLYETSCLLVRLSAISFSFGGEGNLQQHGHNVTKLFSAGATIMIQYTTE